MLVKGWQARLQRDERPEPQDASEWLGKNGVTVAALTLIAIELVWMAVLLAHSYFRQDDFRYLDRALANGLNLHYLMWVDAGHLLPLGFAIAWAMARISLYNWPLTCLFILTLLAATAQDSCSSATGGLVISEPNDSHRHGPPSSPGTRVVLTRVDAKLAREAPSGLAAGAPEPSKRMANTTPYPASSAP